MATGSDRFSLVFDLLCQDMKNIEDILALIGLYYVGKHSLTLIGEIVNGIRVHFWSRLRPPNLRSYGDWAVITGATDGIGKQFVFELARRGISVIIIGKDPSKLERITNEIIFSYGVKVESICMDFNSRSPSFAEVRQKIKGRRVGILVNNVGVMPPHPAVFLESTQEQLSSIVNVNMASTLIMTHLILPGMVERRLGLIINISSMSSFYPLPLMAAYSASKAFVDWFSRSLNYEYKDKGVHIQTLMPSYVSTKLTAFSRTLQRPSIFVPTPEIYVKNAIRTVGYSARTTGYWNHGLQYFLYSLIPEFLWYPCSWYLQKYLDSTIPDQKEQETSSQ